MWKSNKNLTPWEDDREERKMKLLKRIGAAVIAITLITGTAFGVYQQVSQRAIANDNTSFSTAQTDKDPVKNPDMDPAENGKAMIGGGANLPDDGPGTFQPAMPNKEDYPMLNPDEDPAENGKAMIGGGANLPDDGPGASQVATPNKEDYPMPDAKIVSHIGNVPSLQLLQEKRILHVYDENGNVIELFVMTDNGKRDPVQTKDGSWIHMSDSPTYEVVSDITLPEDIIYVDSIKSGRLLEVGGELYVLFDSGSLTRVNNASLMMFNVYDTLITDEDGVTVNTADYNA